MYFVHPSPVHDDFLTTSQTFSTIEGDDKQNKRTMTSVWTTACRHCRTSRALLVQQNPIRLFATKPQVRTSGPDELSMEEKTRTWLQAKTWSSREVTRGQYLIDGWLKSENMPQSTRILRRWIQERAAKNPVVTGQSIVDLLHRVLHGHLHAISIRATHGAVNQQ